MALVLRINNMDEFYEMTHFARKPYYNQLDFQCTRRLFTLTVSRPSPQGRCFIELRLHAPFFPAHYAISSGTNIILHRAISPQQFFSTVLQMKRSGRFDYLMFTLSHLLDSLELSFCNISDPLDLPYNIYFPFLPTYQHLDINRADSSTFVLFHSFVLQSILASSDDSRVALIVTLTTSQAKFTRRDIGRNVGFVLSVEMGECVTEGIAEGEEAQFVTVLDPVEVFNEILSRPNSRNIVGIGRSNNDNNRGIIIINAGLYAQYMFYSSQ